MLNNTGFDLWADEYDESVLSSDDDQTYPFAGYRQVLNRIYGIVRQRNARRVLDVGFGTATLTTKLYQDGCEITGIDFSDRMIEIARAKMPDAALIQHDFSDGSLPDALEGQSFDAIVCTYAIHHLTLERKVRFLRALRARLNPGGVILLGDVAFDTRRSMEVCRDASGDEWDEDECYLIEEELRPIFPDLQFDKISHCAGVMRL